MTFEGYPVFFHDVTIRDGVVNQILKYGPLGQYGPQPTIKAPGDKRAFQDIRETHGIITREGY